jgi:excisionase family DNA binding protein
MDFDLGNLMTTSEVAALLNCSESTVRRHIKAGELNYFRLGSAKGHLRVSGYHVEEFLTRHLPDAIAGEATAPEPTERVT